MDRPDPLTLPPGALDPRRAARTTAFALTAMAVEKGGAMVILLLVARLLGAEDFGRYAALMSLVALFGVFADFGHEPILVRLLAQDRAGEAQALVSGALALRVSLGLGVGLLLVALGPVAFPVIGGVPFLVAAAGLVAASGHAFRALFRTIQRLEWLILTALANVGAFAVALAIAYATDLGLAGVVGAWAVGQLAASLAGALLAAGRLKPRLRWDRSVARRLAGSGWALAVNTLLLTVTLRVGLLIVLHYEGPAAVGYLAAGSKLAEAFSVIPEALMLVLLPVLAAYDRDARTSQHALSVRAVRYLALLALAAIIVVSIAAPDLVVFLYGSAYAAGTPALQILAWMALLAASGTVFNNLLIARGHERVLLGINAFGSVLTIGVSILLVPRVGFVGAAVATLAASALAQATLLVLPATRHDVAACLRPLVPAVLLGVVLTLSGMVVPGPRLAVAASAATIFAVAVLATGTFGRGDWAIVRRVFVQP